MENERQMQSIQEMTRELEEEKNSTLRELERQRGETQKAQANFEALKQQELSKMESI